MTAIDIIGDVHGQLHALQSLGRELGYDVDREDWAHPEGRRLVFLGDLVDRGAHSLEVARIVHGLCRTGRAVCLMGNHEYNLVAHELHLSGYESPKRSNKATIADIKKRRAEWNPVLDFFQGLPIALELTDLRIIHACWHTPSVEAVREQLGPEGARRGDAEHWASEHVLLRSPFDATGLNPQLPRAAREDDEAPHELLMKGYEGPQENPFRDNDGTERTRRRVTWWSESRAPVPRDRTLVVGHYWNLPPMKGTFCPPFSSGTQELREWQSANAGGVPDRGDRACDTAEVICVDYNGLTDCSERACVGALRWPERQVAWATSTRTRARGDE